MNLPMVVTMVLEKNNDCPKLQFGSPVAFLTADTPLLLASTTSLISCSKAASIKKKKSLWSKYNDHRLVSLKNCLFVNTFLK